MRWLIEVQPNVAENRWQPSRMHRSGELAVYTDFATADRVFKDELKCAPNYRLVETLETDAELNARRY